MLDDMVRVCGSRWRGCVEELIVVVVVHALLRSRRRVADVKKPTSRAPEALIALWPPTLCALSPPPATSSHPSTTAFSGNCASRTSFSGYGACRDQFGLAPASLFAATVIALVRYDVPQR